MPRDFWGKLTGKAKAQPSYAALGDGDGVEEETGRFTLLANAANDPQRADALADALEGEPVEDDGALLIPYKAEEKKALKALGLARYLGWAKTGGRAGAGQVVKAVVTTAAGAPGVLATQVPGLLNAGDTTDRALKLKNLAGVTYSTPGLYRERAGQIKDAITDLAHILDARASGQFTNAGTSAGSSGAALALAPAIGVATASLAVPPVALVAVPAAAGVGLAFGAERLTRRVVEQWNDVDRQEIANVLFECSQMEIEHNREVDAVWAEADRAEAENRDEFRDRPQPVPEFAVQALGCVGVTRELLDNPSTTDRVRAMVLGFIS